MATAATPCATTGPSNNAFILPLSLRSSPQFPCCSSRFHSRSLSLSNLKPKHRHLLFSSSLLSPPPCTSQLIEHSPSTPAQSTFDKFIQLLRLSGRCGDVKLARTVHASMLKLEEDTRLSNALIVAYLDLGTVSHAYAVFDVLSNPDVASYSAMASALAKSGHAVEAIELFSRMRQSRIEPNGFTFVAILTACCRILRFELGTLLHSLVIKSGYVHSTFVANALISLYSKCGFVDEAARIFDEMPDRDVASWNTILASFVDVLMYDRAIEMFWEMKEIDGLQADNLTISIVLNACAGCSDQKLGRELHGHALKVGMGSNLSVNNSLIQFYTSCGSINNVQTLFRIMPIKDAFTWTGVISALMEFGMVELALHVFKEMPRRTPVSFNAVLSGLYQNGECVKALDLFCGMVRNSVELSDPTLTSVISACSLLGDRRVSEQIHAFILKFGFGSNDFIENALLDMCTRCQRMSDAKKLFQQRRRSSQSCSIDWTSMICAYARNGKPEESISLFRQGQLDESIVLDQVVLTTMIDICGTVGFAELGQQLHCCYIKSGSCYDLGVGNALVSMYSECGHIQEAIKVFYDLPNRDVVSWNALIASHLLHRQGDEALAVWSRLQEAPIKPDSITFVLVISSFKHTEQNLVEDCRNLFFSMESVYKVNPTSLHYASFVSVLGFWGLLREAANIITNMPLEPDVVVWRALLDGCRIHNNTDMGKKISKHILALEPQDPSTYILQSNIYSISGFWHHSEKIREEMRRKQLSKHPGRSWVIHENQIHSFYARDRRHPWSEDIYNRLETLFSECMESGYVPDTSYVLHEADEYQKKNFLYYHSAKLAVAHGLLTTRVGQPIRITKNIRLCGDCHNFIKYLSLVTERDIYLRDNSGFHCFSRGECNCKDRW